MATKTKIAGGTRATLRADVAYKETTEAHTALAGSFVVVDSVNSLGGAAVRQTILGRSPRETHCFYTRTDNLEPVQ